MVLIFNIEFNREEMYRVDEQYEPSCISRVNKRGLPVNEIKRAFNQIKSGETGGTQFVFPF